MLVGFSIGYFVSLIIRSSNASSDDADDFSARGKNRVGDRTHEPDSGTPIDEPDVSLCEFIAKGMCGLPIGRVFAFAGTAVDADSLHSRRLR